MKRNLLIVAMAAGVFLSALLSQPQEAAAVPAFARQMGMACAACHFQHYPALNSFGVVFKMNGYRLIGAQGKVESKGLSIPDTLNASLIVKTRYQKTNGDSNASTDRGELQFPDEGALLIGGRGGEHVGFLLEMQLPEGDASAFASFKMPIVYGYHGAMINIVSFTTDAGGAAYGFELLNTGAMRMQRALEDRRATSAQQFIGTATEAEGLALVAANHLGFVNATLWAPVHGNADAGLRMSHYLRLAANRRVGPWNLWAGGQYWGGRTKIGDTDANPDQIYNTRAWALDVQGQGSVGSLPLGVYLTYGSAARDKDGAGGETNPFNNGNPEARRAWSVLAELGVLPGKATAALGYRAGHDGSASNSSDNAITLGATYLMAQNVQFQLNQIFYTGSAYDPKPTAGGDLLTTFMLFAAF